MSSPASAASFRPGWGAALAVLLPALAGLLLLFGAEGQAAVRTWSTSSAYNHGWMVLPIAAWLFWERRFRLAEVAPRPAPWLGAALALPLALGWVAAERLGVMEGRQLAALFLLLALVLAVLGWRFFLAFAGPLLFLVFLVPFGEWAVPSLRTITARLVDWGLDLTGIPHHVDALMIETPSGSFYVAEACAGLRFMVATLAFGAVYALVMFRSLPRRLLVMVLAVLVPIGANAVRVLGLVMLAEAQGSAAAVAADHVIYGWWFFLVVIALLILAGMPFREAAVQPGAPVATRPVLPGALSGALPGFALAALLVLGAAGVAVGIASRLAGAPVPPPETRVLALPAFPGCQSEEGELLCPGGRLSARLLVFAPRTPWDRVAAARRAATGGTSDEDLTFDIQAGPARWRARQAQESPEILAVSGFLGGAGAGDGLRSRARQALRGVGLGTTGRPVLAVLRWRADPGTDTTRGRTLLREVLEARGAAIAAEPLARSRTED